MRSVVEYLSFVLVLLVATGQPSGAALRENEDSLSTPSPFVTDVRGLLAGQTPGTVAVSSEGAPWMTPSVYVHGIHPGIKNPAFYVDGVQVSDLGFLAPESIDRIEVLSGAEAILRFGASASCGAISVTTRRASRNGFHASYSFSGAVQQLAFEPRQLSLEEWGVYSPLGGSQNPYLLDRYKTSFAQIHHLNLQSGGEKVNAAATLDYLDNDGPLEGRWDIHRRFSGTARLDWRPVDWIRVELSGAAGRSRKSDLNVLNGILVNELLRPGQEAQDPLSYKGEQTNGTAYSVQAKVEFRPVSGLFVRPFYGLSREKVQENETDWAWDQYGAEAGYARTFGLHGVSAELAFKQQKYHYEDEYHTDGGSRNIIRFNEVLTDLSLRVNYEWDRRLFVGFGVFQRGRKNIPSEIKRPSFAADIRFRPMENWAVFAAWSQSNSLYAPYLLYESWSLPILRQSEFSRLNAGTEASFRFGQNRIDARINGFLDEDRYSLATSRLAVRNLGLELTADLEGRKGDFRFNAGSSLTLFRNQVTEMVEGFDAIGYRDDLQLRKGLPVGIAWLHSLRGYSPENGTPEIGPEQAFGNGLFPTATVGVHASVAWRNWQFSVLGHGNLGQSIFRTVYSPALTRHYLENSWRPENPNALYPNEGYFSSWYDYRKSSAMLLKGSFFRIDQLRLDYNLAIGRGAAVLDLFASLENFLLFTSYPGSDPEYALDWKTAGLETGSYPSTRRIVLGMRINL